MARDVLLGAVIGAQGLKGEVKVKTFTQSPARLGAYGPLHTKDGKRFRVLSVREAKDAAVVALDGVNDRNAAEALKGAELFVPRSALPKEEADEFYHADLVGLRAEDTEGRAMGTIRAVHNFGAGDVLEIVRDDGDEVFLPFTREVAQEIDIEGGRIVIAAPEEIEAGEKGSVE
ncbi:MAG: ribosome maturation factor RimM [Proteobacteria bacterium]|nr:ribosome maturation factor RimM [Pseudomonadota bacterium]